MDTKMAFNSFNSKKSVVNVNHGKEPSCLMYNGYGAEFSDKCNTSTSSNAKAKISLTGIQRRRICAARIRERIRHKKVWLDTSDTVEEASQAYFSKQSELEDEKLSQQGNKKSKRIGETTGIVDGVHKKNKRGKYNSEIRNSISKKRIWLGTFGTAKEASQAYQSKKLEFNAMQQQCTNKHTQTEQDDKSEELVNVNCEIFHTELAGGSETDVPISNSSNGGTGLRIDSHEIGTAAEAFRVYQPKKKQAFSDISKEASKGFNSCLISNVHGTKSSDECNNTTSCNIKDKRSFIGIRRQKSGRYAAVITDPIRHKKVWLGTFDTIEEASQAYFSKKSEFEKLSQQGRKENKPKKKCDHIQQPESPSVEASFSMANHQTSTSDTTSRSGRDKRIDSHNTTTHIIGAHKSKTRGRYTSEITNPITKKKIWLGTFDTAEEASRAYQSKKLEFQKLVNTKQQQQCTNHKQTHSEQDAGEEKLVIVKQGHKNVNCELKSSHDESEINVPISNSCSEGTEERINSHEIGATEKVEMQSNMSTDSSARDKQVGQEDDEDLWMGEWVQLPGSNRAVLFSLKLGLPIIDNYGSLLGEFSSLDDLSIYVTEDGNQT